MRVGIIKQRKVMNNMVGIGKFKVKVLEENHGVVKIDVSIRDMEAITEVCTRNMINLDGSIGFLVLVFDSKSDYSDKYNGKCNALFSTSGDPTCIILGEIEDGRRVAILPLAMINGSIDFGNAKFVVRGGDE